MILAAGNTRFEKTSYKAPGGIYDPHLEQLRVTVSKNKLIGHIVYLSKQDRFFFKPIRDEDIFVDPRVLLRIVRKTEKLNGVRDGHRK